MSKPQSKWNLWSISEWNEVLFNFFFLNKKGITTPVERLIISKEKLADATGDKKASPGAVQKAFLSAIQVDSYTLDYDKLSVSQLDSNLTWPQNEVPPFCVYLLFTCLVASPTDTEIRGVGDFRKRLALLMGHASGTSYQLQGLPRLWEALEEWLCRQNIGGVQYHNLELPDPGFMTRIGYSMGLAFPPRRDQLKLIELLSKEGLSENPPVKLIFKLVGYNLNSFSKTFKKAYENFRRAYTESHKNISRLPFWSAIREAITSELHFRGGQGDVKAEFKLIVETNENSEAELLALSDFPVEVLGREIAYTKANTPYGEFQYVLTVARSKKESFKRAAQLILGRRRLDDAFVGPKGRAIGKTVEQGVLLFHMNEYGIREMMVSRRDDGDYLALVRESLAHDFASAFPNERRPRKVKSQYSNCLEIGPFQGELLANLAYGEYSPLASIYCLQKTINRPRISFVGGCPLDGGYLGVAFCLPKTRIPTATSVVVSRLGKEGAPESFSLRQHDEELSEFIFDRESKALSGQYEFVASDEGKIIDRKVVLFRSHVAVDDYASPTKPNLWWVESSGPEISAFADVTSVLAISSQVAHSPVQQTLSSATTKTPSLNWSDKKEVCREIGENLQPIERLSKSSPDEFMEFCAGLATRKKGILDGEFLTFIQGFFGVNMLLTWDIARLLVELGHFDKLSFKNWRSSTYFARSPRLVIHRKGGFFVGALMGLTTNALRGRIKAIASDQGATLICRQHGVHEALTPLMWRAQTDETFKEISSKAALGELEYLGAPSEIMWSLNRVVSNFTEMPMNFDQEGTWNWQKGHFDRSKATTGHGVEIVWMRRKDQPDWFDIRLGGTSVWWSRSRNWALLVANAFRGKVPFKRHGESFLARHSNAQVYLPIFIGRYLAATSTEPSGPMFGTDTKISYVYGFSDRAQREGLMGQLFEITRKSVTSIDASMILLSSLVNRFGLSDSSSMVPLPVDLRKKIERMDYSPEIFRLARSNVHPSMISRIKTILDTVEETGG